MHREWTIFVEESRIYYPIIKAVLLKNMVQYENTDLKLWRTNLYLDIQMQNKCINISSLYEVPWGHVGSSTVQSHSHSLVTTQNFMMLLLPRLTCHVFSCSSSKCYRMRGGWGWRPSPEGWAESASMAPEGPANTLVTGTLWQQGRGSGDTEHCLWKAWLARCSFTGNSEGAL